MLHWLVVFLDSDKPCDDWDHETLSISAFPISVDFETKWLFMQRGKLIKRGKNKKYDFTGQRENLVNTFNIG